MSSQLAWTAAAGASLRLILANTWLPSYLGTRNELSTPVSSFARLKEGIFIARQLGRDPYAGGSFHQSPLLLALPAESDELCWLVYALTDVLTALLLHAVARGRQNHTSEQKQNAVAAVYLFHPFSIAAFLARTNISFVNLAVALALYCASEGNTLAAAVALSTATQLGLYPVLLLPAILLLSHRSVNDRNRPSSTLVVGTLGFVCHFVLSLAACRHLLGSWSFLRSFYGVVLSIPDLTPTIGLGWYFFIEMFDHFRLFFVGVFQLHTLIYVVPFAYYCRDDPLVAVLLQWGVVSLFGTYPELGYFAFLHTLMAMLPTYHPYLSRLTFFVPVTLYALALLPSFHYLWLYEGSGNANFFYASTLVWTIGQGGLLVDWLSAFGKHRVRLELGDEKWKNVETGKWAVLQR